MSAAAPLAWNPDVYLAFASYRARPVSDLMSRIVLPETGVLYDLGCGPGNVTAKIRARWPDRAVVGIDSSPAMLDAAARAHEAARITWELADVARWAPSAPAALIFSNAALHWVAEHEALFMRLAANLAPGGVLAVQMPLAQDTPYHTCIHATARDARWSAKLAAAHRQTTPLTARAYYGLLAPLAAEIDIWETDYHHVLDGEDPVAAWAAGTALLPYTTLLDADDTAAFKQAYATALRAAYPREADGRTLFCMRRLFIVARRRL